MGGWRPADLDKSSSGRALRNRRHRKILQDSHQAKRLFTPEIKKFLKGWLVRRRKNPYPNRTEKKELAFKTGLTYIQICNWFANWRRKLKNSSQNSDDSWGLLIKDYNNKAKGNVEQFSISSDDSIWDEAAYGVDEENNATIVHDQMESDHCYSTPTTAQLRRDDGLTIGRSTTLSRFESEWETEKPVLLTRWLESAAKFTHKDSYLPWSAQNMSWVKPNCEKFKTTISHGTALRHKKELDAAEALTFLSVAPSVT